jgi:hypothetical protein
MIVDRNDVLQGLLKNKVPYSDAKILAAVAAGESGYRSDAAGDGGKSIGILQINTQAHGDKLEKWTGSKDFNVWKKWLENPDNNYFAAAEVYHSQGLGAWTVYKTGAWKKYYPSVESVIGNDDGGQLPQYSLLNPKFDDFAVSDFNEQNIIENVFGVSPEEWNAKNPAAITEFDLGIGGFLVKWLIIIVLIAALIFTFLKTFESRGG